jgi:hypothetical protein
MFLPEQLAEVSVDGEEIVVGAGDERDLLEPAVGDRAFDDERTIERVDRSLLRLELDLPQQLQILDRVFRDLRFAALPAVALIAAAVRHPVGAAERRHDEARGQYRPCDQSSHRLVPSLRESRERADASARRVRDHTSPTGALQAPEWQAAGSFAAGDANRSPKRGVIG